MSKLVFGGPQSRIYSAFKDKEFAVEIGDIVRNTRNNKLYEVIVVNNFFTMFEAKDLNTGIMIKENTRLDFRIATPDEIVKWRLDNET
jgi:hypothetical protein